jgi:hypothetical protein
MIVLLKKNPTIKKTFKKVHARIIIFFFNSQLVTQNPPLLSPNFNSRSQDFQNIYLAATSNDFSNLCAQTSLRSDVSTLKCPVHALKRRRSNVLRSLSGNQACYGSDSNQKLL